nr:metallopeptidase family protein [Bowdeniella massiliensis]
MPMVPPRRAGRRRDRHGRGIRGPLLPPALPGWRTKREIFDDIVTGHVRALMTEHPRLAAVEFAVEEVPPSNPSRFEARGITLARTFAADRSHGLKYRVVLYRLPIATRCASVAEIDELTHYVLIEQCAEILGVAVTDLDPDFPL